MRSLFYILFVVGLFTASDGIADERHDHHHHGDASLDQLELNEGEKWAGDEHLRRGMQGIREVFVAIHDRVRDGEADSDDYKRLADAIDEQVQYMFANCHLDPEPDAQLHVILANLIQASETLRGEENHYPGVHRVHQSLDAYGDTFRHEGWTPVGHH
jgi:hypothetical protein